MKKILNKFRRWLRKGKALPNEHGPRILLKQNEACCGEGCCVNKVSSRVD